MRTHYEVLSKTILEDIGFEQTFHNQNGYSDSAAEEMWRHPVLDSRNMLLIWSKDFGYSFEQRTNAMTSFGKMHTLDDLIAGWKFVTQTDLLK